MLKPCEVNQINLTPSVGNDTLKKRIFFVQEKAQLHRSTDGDLLFEKWRKQWRKEHPFYHKTYNKSYSLRKPWVKTLRSINSRCNNKTHHYYKKDIKSFLTMKSLEYLWFRDKAYLMIKPSIHRKNSLKNYTIKNCEYMELKKNLSYPKYLFYINLIKLIKNKYPNIIKKCIKELKK